MMIHSQVKDDMLSLKHILGEVDKLQESEVLLLLHILIDRIRPPLNHSTEAGVNPFRKYRGRAKGVWKQDAQAYVNELRHEERF